LSKDKSSQLPFRGSRNIDIRMAVKAFRNANAMLSFGGFLLFVGIVFLPFNLYSAAQMLDRMYVDPGSAEWTWTMYSIASGVAIGPAMALFCFFAVATVRSRLSLVLWFLVTGNIVVSAIVSFGGAGEYFQRAGLSFNGPAIAQMIMSFGVLIILALAALRSISPGLSLSALDRKIARPTPQMPHFSSILRNMFGVWPGLRRSIFAASMSAVFAYLSGLIANLGVLIRMMLILSLIAVPVSLSQASGGYALGAFVFILLLAIVFYILAVLFRLSAQGLRNGARGLSRQSMEKLVSRDKRPPILFLRSFADDQVTLQQLGFWSRLMRGETPKRRLDHMLVEHFARYGPVVAIGRPGEKSLPFGAARIYVTDDKWQEVVIDLATKAGHIVLLADPTPGVAWEVQTMFGEKFRAKTLFLAPPKSNGLDENPLVRSCVKDLDIKERVPAHAIAIYFERGTSEGANEFTVLESPDFTADAYHVALQAFFRRNPQEALPNTT